MSRGAPPWAQVKLRVSFGDVPDFGDILQMRTGRRYQVIGVRGRQLQCLVLPVDADTGDARVLEWQWASRDHRVSG